MGGKPEGIGSHVPSSSAGDGGGDARRPTRQARIGPSCVARGSWAPVSCVPVLLCSWPQRRELLERIHAPVRLRRQHRPIDVRRRAPRGRRSGNRRARGGCHDRIESITHHVDSLCHVAPSTARMVAATGSTHRGFKPAAGKRGASTCDRVSRRAGAGEHPGHVIGRRVRASQRVEDGIELCVVVFGHVDPQGRATCRPSRSCRFRRPRRAEAVFLPLPSAPATSGAHR